MIPQHDILVLTIAEGIAQKEGFYQENTRAKRNNNPGCLKDWDDNLPLDSEGYTEFLTVGDGFKALYAQIHRNIYERELTLKEFFHGKEGVYFGFSHDTTYPLYMERFLEDRGFYPLSRDHVLKHWFTELNNGKQGNIETQPASIHKFPVSGSIGKLPESYPNMLFERMCGNPTLNIVQHKETDNIGLKIGNKTLFVIDGRFNCFEMPEDQYDVRL